MVLYPSRTREGDLVLIISENTPPCKWPLTFIVKTHPGKNGAVRLVILRSTTSTLTRPITKIAFLTVRLEEELMKENL